MIKYRIYENREGLMKRPTEYGYGDDEEKYDDFDSLEEADKAIQKEDYPPTYIVLPIIEEDS